MNTPWKVGKYNPRAIFDRFDNLLGSLPTATTKQVAALVAAVNEKYAKGDKE